MRVITDAAAQRTFRALHAPDRKWLSCGRVEYRLLLILLASFWGVGCGSSKTAAESRKAAELVLLRGGSIVPRGLDVPVKTASKLPAGKFGVLRIELKGRPFTDADLEQIQGLTGVETLGLQDTQITDAGLAHLKGFKQLQDLSLYGTRITDKGLEQLNSLTRLKKLELSYTSITDAGLDQLIALRNLESLYLHGTSVTNTGVAKLKKALSGCKIYK